MIAYKKELVIVKELVTVKWVFKSFEIETNKRFESSTFECFIIVILDQVSF